MGHNPEQIALHGHLLQQGPAAIGIPLEPEAAAIHGPAPTQAIGGINLQWALNHRGAARAIQHGLPRLRVGFAHQAAGLAWIWTTQGRPNLPIRRMGHHSLGTFCLPRLGLLQGRFMGCKGAQHLPLDGQRLRQGLLAPTHWKR